MVDLLKPGGLRLALVADIFRRVAPSSAVRVQVGGVRKADIVGQIESVQTSLTLVQESNLVFVALWNSSDLADNSVQVRHFIITSETVNGVSNHSHILAEIWFPHAILG